MARLEAWAANSALDVCNQYISDGKIVLNISPSACINFHLDTEWLTFQARFAGQPMDVSFPCLAVAAIYAKENGAGTAFVVPPPPVSSEKPKPVKEEPTISPVESTTSGDSNNPKTDGPGKDKVSHLKVIK